MVVQSEKAGAGQAQELVATGVHVVARRSEQNEWLLETQRQFGDHTTKNVALGLNRENDRDGLRRPGTDLTGVWDGEIIVAGIQTESLANGATEFGPIEVQGSNLGKGESERGAEAGFAAADSGDGGLRSGSSFADDTVSAAAIPWARK